MIFLEELKEEILQIYKADTTRFYHNDQHIIEMFKIAEEKQLELSVAQYIAILFHDIVYIPNDLKIEGLNEKLSCSYMRNYFSKLNIEKIIKNDIDIAEKIILSTIHHLPIIQEAELVLDLDLYRLSVDKEEFEKNSLDIFYEYLATFEEENIFDKLKKYKENRKIFLQKFLERDSIYFTEHFQIEEITARINLENL